MPSALRTFPDKRLADVDPDEVKELADPGDMTVEDARLAVGRAVARAIARSQSPLKAFGDEGAVCRWLKGENPNLARLWRRKSVRRELLVALAEESGFAEVQLTVTVR